ncbi:MAG: iron ABC transporter substrate-binding protein [Candidatus Bathyarchaeota archaeon]|nr:iron ABC transporter substrate-binding protein [Candidatus Bathyarchaeota archaeon]
MKKLYVVLAVVAIALIATVSFASLYNAPASEPVSTTQEITDMAGRTVTVPTSINRVVAVNTGTLRLLTYLGASDLICAVEEVETDPSTRPYSIAHPEYATLPLVGPGHGGDPELIGAQNPDIVFKADVDTANLDNLQTQLGVPVIGIVAPGIDSPEEIDLFYDALNLMGQILDKEDRATEIINYIEGIVSDLDSRTSSISDTEKLSVYVGGLSYRGTHGLISTSAYYAPFTLTNAKNVVTDEMVQGVTNTVSIDAEIIPGLNPDVMFIDYAGFVLCKDDVANHPDVYSNMVAIQNNRVYGVMPYGSYGSQIDVTLTDAYYVGTILYPDQFADIDPVEKANEIYNFLLGMSLYDDVAATLGAFGPVNLLP